MEDIGRRRSGLMDDAARSKANRRFTAVLPKH